MLFCMWSWEYFYRPPVDKKSADKKAIAEQEKIASKSKRLNKQIKDIKKNLKVKRF